MKIGILGTGSWATGLATVLTDNGHEVPMYGISQEEIQDINVNHRNSKYFPDVELSTALRATDQLEAAIAGAEFILITIPTQFVRTVLKQVSPLLDHPVTFINASKGFDDEK